jgi:hypothetical protein
VYGACSEPFECNMLNANVIRLRFKQVQGVKPLGVKRLFLKKSSFNNSIYFF